MSKIIKETCDAIYECLKDEYRLVPTIEEEWLKISNQFEESWNMLHAVGTLDGKHIRIECPKLSGSLYHK